MPEPKITEIRRDRSLWGTPCLVATVEADDLVMELSQLDGEQPYWYADACFGAKNCYPYFSHGTGDRSVGKQRVNPDSPVAAELNHRATEIRQKEALHGQVARS